MRDGVCYDMFSSKPYFSTKKNPSWIVCFVCLVKEMGKGKGGRGEKEKRKRKKKVKEKKNKTRAKRTRTPPHNQAHHPFHPKTPKFSNKNSLSYLRPIPHPTSTQYKIHPSTPQARNPISHEKLPSFVQAAKEQPVAKAREAVPFISANSRSNRHADTDKSRAEKKKAAKSSVVNPTPPRRRFLISLTCGELSTELDVLVVVEEPGSRRP